LKPLHYCAIASLSLLLLSCGPIPNAMPDHCDEIDFNSGGGDPTAESWNVTDTCYPQKEPVVESCPAADVDVDADASGTIGDRFDIERTYTFTYSIPESCVSEDEGCDAFDTLSLDFGRDGDGCAAVDTETASATFDIRTEKYNERENTWRVWDEDENEDFADAKIEFDVRRNFGKLLLREELDGGQVLYIKAEKI
jgi:hypothetical protein